MIGLIARIRRSVPFSRCLNRGTQSLKAAQRARLLVLPFGLVITLCCQTEWLSI